MSFHGNMFTRHHQEARARRSRTPRPPAQHLPLFERQLQVNPQKDSILFNGIIPAEVRDQIFFYAVYEREDASPWPLNTKYTRPGYTSDPEICISLLQTCRRIYLETYHLPIFKKEFVFWHGASTGPLYQSLYEIEAYSFDTELELFDKLQPWQRPLVKEIHLFTQMFWLEQTFPEFCQHDIFAGIETLKITIRRSDWWWNERNHPLVINPHRETVQADPCIAEMHRDIAVQQRGGAVPWLESAWGAAFQHLPSLKEVEIELETSDDKKAELETIVKWAKTWRFPLDHGKVLSTEGREPTITSWQSPFSMWTAQCPYCRTDLHSLCNSKGTPNEEKCAEMADLRSRGLGPKCHVYSLRWRAVEDTNRLAAEHPLL
jgi:hypothetical protein